MSDSTSGQPQPQPEPEPGPPPTEVAGPPPPTEVAGPPPPTEVAGPPPADSGHPTVPVAGGEPPSREGIGGWQASMPVTYAYPGGQPHRQAPGYASQGPPQGTYGNVHDQSYGQSYSQSYGQYGEGYPYHGRGSEPPPDGGYGQPHRSPEPSRPGRAGRTIAMLAAVLVIAGCSAVAGGAVGAWSTQQFQGAPGPGETRVIDGPQLDRPSLAGIAAQVQPSVVSIDVGTGQGSGVIMDTDGHILTNAHVVAAGTGRVTVRLSNGQRLPAQVVGADTRSDIAVVRAQEPADLTPAEFGSSADVLVGDTVLAIGSPLGLQGTVTQGIVSALDRTLSPRPNGHTLSGLMQTDAAINRGNSGGPLVNLSGEVIGINTAIAVENDQSGFLGVGFAVPSDRALQVAEALIAGEEVRHAFLGVRIDSFAEGGAHIQTVDAGSPAAEAGIQEGDVVTRFGDRPISDANDLVSAVQASRVGDTVQVELERDGETLTLEVTLGEHND
jgi:putative serine protease PepD